LTLTRILLLIGLLLPRLHVLPLRAEYHFGFLVLQARVIFHFLLLLRSEEQGDVLLSFDYFFGVVYLPLLLENDGVIDGPNNLWIRQLSDAQVDRPLRGFVTV